MNIHPSVRPSVRPSVHPSIQASTLLLFTDGEPTHGECDVGCIMQTVAARLAADGLNPAIHTFGCGGAAQLQPSRL